jgi:TonB family protein
VRNSVANFKRTSVPLKLDISFEQRPAITGKVTVLQAFDPANSTIFPPTPSLPSPPPPGSMKGGVTAGRALHKIPPFYPLYAKANHISGAVLLHAIISRQGAVTGIFPIASPDTGLTAAAIDAVKQWTYQPFLLNGQPTDVETTIQVNFNMR